MLKYLILIVCCLFIHRVDGAACTASVCVAPDCICSTTKPPGGQTAADVTQMIILVFEGSLSTGNYPNYYKPLLDGIKNPNGCNISATFFIDHEYTDYSIVNKAWVDGHDIGVQSITGLPFTGIDEATIFSEINGEATFISIFAQLNISEIQGVRAPQTASGGNNQFDAIFQSHLLYDSTLVTRSYAYPYWPYTLDYQTTQDCTNGPCPTNSYPGLFEIPVTDFLDGNNNICNNLVQCIYNGSVTNAYDLLHSNYQYHKAQKVPYLIPIPLSWLTINSTNSDGLRSFLSEAITQDQAYVISMNRAIAWFQNEPIADITTFEPWQCTTPRTSSCLANTCQYNFTGQSVSMVYCASADCPSCPAEYPWINSALPC